ncbi:MAG TPA: VOC family protein, partial [Gammaproteobacteria bacterium]|nr:VOC family protein [Gammaproteobacteria bacterium]
MSRLFGSIRQMGYVVRDVEQAIKHWVEVCGIGPWYYVDKLPVKDFHYRGQPGSPHR